MSKTEQVIPKEVGLTVRTLRAARRISQETLAGRVGLPQNTISQIELARYRPTMMEWTRIWNVLTSE